MPVQNVESESKLEDALKSLRRPNDCIQPERSFRRGASAETYFSNWSIIRHVADFLESTLSYGNRGFPRDRGRPVYFGKQPVAERVLGRPLVTRSRHSRIALGVPPLYVLLRIDVLLYIRN